MTTVHAVGVNDRYLFAATPNALGIYDRRFGYWLPPFSRIDGWPTLPIAAALADPIDQDAFWFVAGNAVYRYRVGFTDLIRALVPGRIPTPVTMFIDAGVPGAGLIVRTDADVTSSYVRVSPTGFVQPVDARTVDPRPGMDPNGRPVRTQPTTRYRPQTPADIFARYPALRGFERLLTQDASLRSWQIASAAAHPNISEVWFGTVGGGVFKIDPVFTRGEQVPFGLLAEGAGAIALGADGVWIGGAGVGGDRDGLTFADHATARWRWLDGGGPPLFGGARVTSLSMYGSLLWAASHRGVALLDVQRESLVRRWDDASGLPSADVRAVAATNTGAWVGTARGLTFIADDGTGARGARVDAVRRVVLDGVAVRALVRRGDTLWIGSDIGVLVLPRDSTVPRRLRAADNDQRLTQPVVAIATADSVVAIATERGEVFRVDTRTGGVLDGTSVIGAGRVGDVRAIAIDSATVWIGGSAGVVIVERSTGLQRALTAGGAVPTDVFGIVLTREYAWIAARDAAVRLTRLRDGTVR
jgi:hypothetical protein